MAAPFLLLILALSCVVSSFDLFEESRAIPADGFHDLLDLTPFWLSEHQAEDLRRTLGTKRDNLPEAWNTLVAQTTGAKTYTIAGRCSVEAAVTEEKVTLTNKGSGGCVKASLKMIFEKLFPAINVMSSTQKFIYPDKFFFEKLEISKASKEVKIDGKAKDPWRVLSGDNFVLTDVSLSLGFTAGVPVQGIKEWAIKATGTLAVSSHSLKMVIDKPKGKEAMPFKWDIETLLMVDIMGIFGVTISQLNFMGIGLSTDNLEGVTFANPECTGEIGLVDDIETSGSETFQLVCKASVSNSKAMKSGDVYLVLTRAKGQVVRPAIIIDVKDIFNIQEALEHFISEGAFISDFSMLGRIERDCIIMIAKDDIIMVNNAALMKLVGPFITPYDTKQIPKGVHVRVKIPLKENMKKGCKMDLPESEIPDILPITIEIKPGGLNFKFPDKFKSNMPKFLKCLDPQIQAELPSQLFPRPDGLINIKEITIGQGRYFKMTIVLQGPFKFLGGKIQVADLEVSIEREKGSNDLKFTGVTTITVGKLAVGLTLEKEGNTYTFSAYVESFKLDQLEQMIGSNDILDFVKFLGKLKDFGIKDFKLVKEFGAGSEHKSLRIAGQPILWGYENVFCEGLIWKPRQGGSTQQPKTAIAVGIVIESVRLDKILEKILGDNLFSAAWFSEMTCIFIISNADGKVEASDDPKGKANDIDKAKEGKADSPDKDKPSPPGRSTVGGNYNGHPHVLERYARGLRYRTHLSHLRKRGQSLHTPSYANYMQRFNSAQRSTRPHLRQHYQNTSLHRRVDTGKAGGKAGDKSAEKPKGDGEDDKADDKKEDDEEEEAEIKFKVPYLSSRDIKPGLTFIGIFNIPQSHKCYGDSLCLWLAEKVGKDATLEISGRIGKGEFEFGAKFSGTIPINSDGSLVIQSIELKLVLSGKKSSIKLECTLYWNIPESLGSSQVQFIGGIEVSLTGKLSLTFAMANMWKNPFRVEYLAFGNLNLGIGIAVGLPIPSFEFGGEVWVGVIDSKGSNDHAIKIACYFGIDVNRPDDNYIYASVNQFTIGAIFRAFKLAEPKDIPKFVRESGFPEGITVAYSTKGKEIDALDIKIEAGLYLKGTLNFLGFKVAAEVIVQLPRLLIDVELSPIDWAGGLIQLRRSADDRDNGPKAFIYLTASSVTVQINGYISLLGMSREVKIDVSDTAFKFEMKTDLWGMIRSELYVEAAYGSLAALAFEFRARVIIDLHLDKIFQAGKKYLKKGADIAIKKLEEAKKKVEEAERSLRNAKGKMEGWKSNINAFQNRLKRRAAQIEEAKKKFRVDCERECGTVCIPFLDWKSRCFKIMWWWVGCPYWNSCRWRVKNFICIAGCEIKKLAKKFVAWAEQIGIKILIGLAEIGKGLIDVGKGFVTMAEGLVSFGKDVLSFVQKVIEVGSKILSDVMDWLAENLFKIDLLELRAKLTPDFNACVGMTVKCVIVGVKIDYSGDICVNLNFWDNLAADTVEKKYPGVKKMNNEVPTIDGKLSEFDNDKKDLDKKGKNIEKDVKRETGKVKRDTVPTAEEMYYKRLAEDPLPPVITRSEATVNFFKNDAPWVLVQDFDTRNLDHAPRIDENIPADKRTLDEDWEKHAATPCVQINKVISKYSMIADGLHSLYHSMRDVRENYQATKRTMQQGVDNLESDVRDTEMKHNMTHEERTDLYHWYNEAKDGLDKWDSKTKRILADEHELVLPRFRSQIEHILKREKNTNFKGYMEELHHVGEAAYKRSNIPNKNMIEAAQELKGIKKDLINLVQSDESNQLRFGAKVRSIRTNIKGLRRSMERCN